jgi:hypothetical protein
VPPLAQGRIRSSTITPPSQHLSTLALQHFSTLALQVWQANFSARLAALGVFAGEIGLFFVLLLAVALIPMLIGVYAGLKLRAKKRADAERARGSVLKHVWEERQHREW